MLHVPFCLRINAWQKQQNPHHVVGIFFVLFGQKPVFNYLAPVLQLDCHTRSVGTLHFHKHPIFVLFSVGVEVLHKRQRLLFV